MLGSPYYRGTPRQRGVKRRATRRRVWFGRAVSPNARFVGQLGSALGPKVGAEREVDKVGKQGE
jgi:hypothetical protein